MVLATSSSQYKLLQALSVAYATMLRSLDTAACLSNPSLFTNCSTEATNFYPYTSLPSVSSVISPPYNYDEYIYTDYSTVTFYGFGSKNFTKVSKKLVGQTASLLTAACGSNSACTKQWKKTSKPSDVATALAQTNINTIQSVLDKNPGGTWIPSSNGYYTRIYTDLPSSGAETFGMHDAALRGVIKGSFTASDYLQQITLGSMLNGGAGMYETLLHISALGSYDGFSHSQANINLTGTQVFELDGNGAIQNRITVSKAAQPVSNEEHTYSNKWQVWRELAEGVTMDSEELKATFAHIKANARASQGSSPAPGPFDALKRAAGCDPSADTKDGIDWLNAIDKGCQVESFVSAALDARGAVDKVLKSAANGAAGFPKAYADACQTFADILAGQVVSLCGQGIDGFPCYRADTAWQIGTSVGTVTALALDVAKFSTPEGAVIGTLDLFCALAPIAAKLYKQDSKCCNSNCKSSSCQMSVYGCTQGTGLC